MKLADLRVGWHHMVTSPDMGTSPEAVLTASTLAKSSMYPDFRNSVDGGNVHLAFRWVIQTFSSPAMHQNEPERFLPDLSTQ